MAHIAALKLGHLWFFDGLECKTHFNGIYSVTYTDKTSEIIFG